MALALKLVGAIELEHAEPSSELRVLAHLRTNDGRHLASVRSGATQLSAYDAMWNEELVLPVSTEAGPTVASVLLELQGGAEKSGGATGASPTALGFVTVDWADVLRNAVKDGWALEARLLSAHGKPLGGSKLLLRLLYSDAAGAATRLRELKGQVADSMAAAARERSAILVASAEQDRQLAAVRAQLGLKLRGVSQSATDKEVSAFRAALEKRLHAARTSRDSALHNFNQMHQAAIAEAMPKIADRVARCATQQEEAIARTAKRHRAHAAAAAEQRRERLDVQLVAERDEALAKVAERTTRAAHRIQTAFRRATSHEGGTLVRRLRRIGTEAEERAKRECAALQKQGDTLAKTIVAGRADIDSEAAEAVGTVRLEVSRLAGEWSNKLSAHYRASREQLGRQLLEHQSAHREQRAARRVIDASAEQSRRAALARRESSLAEHASEIQKEVDAQGAWLRKRIDAAHAAAAASRTAGSLGRPVDLGEMRLRFDTECLDLRGRMEAQRSSIAKLRTRGFVAQAKGGATAQVAEVMKAVEERCVEIMGATAEVSATGVDALKAELGELLSDVAKRHAASLSTSFGDTEGVERELLAPSVRDAPKHATLLSQLEHEMNLSLQIAISRPSEWFEVLGQALRLDEGAIAERREKMEAATEKHADELGAHSMRAADEVKTEEALQAKREAQLRAEAEAAARRIEHERRDMTCEQLPMPDLAAAIREAVERAKVEGQEHALERRRAAFERIDLVRPKASGGGGEAGSERVAAKLHGGRGGEGGGGGASLDGRFHHGGVLRAAEVGSTPESELLARLREHFHRVVAEANTTQPHAAAAATLTMEWTEEALEGKHGLSPAESAELVALEASLAEQLRETIRDEHLEFAAKIKALHEERDSLLREPPPLSDAQTKAEVARELEEGGREVRQIDEQVASLRAELAAVNLAALPSPPPASPTKHGSVDDVRRAVFLERLAEQHEHGVATLAEQISTREEASASGTEVRASQLTAREALWARRMTSAQGLWRSSLDEALASSSTRLEPVRKRLTAAKRSLASELIGALRAESEERAHGLVRYNLQAEEAAEWAWSKQLEALVARHELEASQLAALRQASLEHTQPTGAWSEGFLPALTSAGAIPHDDGSAQTGSALGGRRPLSPSRPMGVPSEPAASGALSALAGANERHEVHLTANPLPVAAARATEAFVGRPRELLLAKLQPRQLRADKPLPPPPLARIDVPVMLDDIRDVLLHEDGATRDADADAGAAVAWPWELASLHGARALNATLERDAEPRPVALPPPTEEDAATANQAASAAALEAARSDPDARTRAQRREAIERSNAAHAAQLRSLQESAERAVAAQRAPARAAAAESASTALDDLRAKHAEDEARAREETKAAKARAVGELQEQVRSANPSRAELNAQLWSEALLRRQAEDTTIHARRLRQEAQAAVSGTLGERGEKLKEQLASVRQLISTISAAKQEPADGA